MTDTIHHHRLRKASAGRQWACRARSRQASGLVAAHASIYHAGLSLVEVLFATVIVSFILVTSLDGLGGALKMWNVATWRSDAYGLAEQLMAEIMQQEYKEPGTSLLGIDLGESASNRADWDDVDDYDGWSSAPQYKDGTPITGFSMWRRQVEVKLVQRASPNTTTLLDEGLKRITVRVTDPDGQVTALVAWRSEWGSLQTEPEANEIVQTWVGSEMTVNGGISLESGTMLLNRPE
ncbi:MAG TPA: hypothetical protein VMM76_07605 [Pirellulaceae bacterium]|nr:hypothetical protein [Pirellulaceae bacterium]